MQNENFNALKVYGIYFSFKKTSFMFTIKNKLFLRAVLGSQQDCVESTEYNLPPPTGA